MNQTIDEKIAKFWYDADGADGASEDELVEAERRIGFALPVEFKKLLRLRDGGIPNYNLFGDILFAPIRGVANKAGTGHLVDLYLQGGAEALPPDVVIFADDADAWFGFDYRENRECPSVLHWSEYEEEPVQLAVTFRSFLEQLSNGAEV